MALRVGAAAADDAADGDGDGTAVDEEADALAPLPLLPLLLPLASPPPRAGLSVGCIDAPSTRMTLATCFCVIRGEGPKVGGREAPAAECRGGGGGGG